MHSRRTVENVTREAVNVIRNYKTRSRTFCYRVKVINIYFSVCARKRGCVRACLLMCARSRGLLHMHGRV